MSGLNQGGYRNVSINFGTAVSSTITVPKAPLDFYKAVDKWVEEFEYKYNKKPADYSNLSAVTVLLYGRTPFDVFKATVSVTVATGDYTVAFVGRYNTVEQATA